MRIIYKGISIIFHPVFVPLIGFLLLYSLSGIDLYLSKDVFWFSVLVIFQFTVLIPLSLTYFLYWKNKISSVELSVRSERPIPLLINLLSVTTNFLVFRYFSFSGIITNFFGVIVIVSALSLLISLWYKISLHIIAWGTLAGVIFAFSLKSGMELHFVISIILLITAFVATARLWLKEHSNTQIATAWLSSIVLSFFIITIF